MPGHDLVKNTTTECRDDFFGPTVWTIGCRGGFDFTIVFEESILTILPAALFLLCSVPRVTYLLLQEDRMTRGAVYISKVTVACLFTAVQVVLLSLICSTKSLNTRLAIAAGVLNLLAACAIALVSHAEHAKSIRPSFILSIYLFTSLLFDAARLRTEWLVSVNISYAAVLTLAVGIKFSILILESIEKRSDLIHKSEVPSTESTSGPFSRGFFVWIDSLLLSGWSNVLTSHDLPSVHEKLLPEKLAARFNSQWEKSIRTARKPSLVIATFKVLKWELVGIILPRVALIALNLSRPFLITSALRFFSMPDSPSTTNLGYGLIGAFFFVFVGSALMTAWYEHLTFRAAAMTRGGLITLIYRKMIRLPIHELNESAAVSLMGNDIETLSERLRALLVDIWANALTVGFAIWLLAEQLGAVCIVPVLIACISLLCCGVIGKIMAKRQIVYQKATQDRINFTSEVLGSMKAVKMLGYSERFSNLMLAQRDRELKVGKEYRQLIVWSNGFAHGTDSLTQVATFGAYAIVAKLSGSSSFSASQAVTVLSILSVLSTPLSELTGNISLAISSFSCFRRIQDFLLLSERTDKRAICDHRAAWRDEKNPIISTSTLQHGQDCKANARVSINDGSFAWAGSSVLIDINTSMPQNNTASLTMIVGPIGSGKSTLLKSILGETEMTEGVVSLSCSGIAFCDQSPWIMNASIRDNIIGESKGFDSSWFEIVVAACDLEVDLSMLPEGASTVVGDKGLKLSGGQKQRLAIARAVYSRKRVAMFDDPFSGLDKVTEQAVFSRVFAKNGLLQKNGITIILATHAVHRLPDADYILVLGANGMISEQGTFEKLRMSGQYVQALDISEPDDDAGENACSETQIPKSEVPVIELRTGEAEEKTTYVSRDRSTFKYYLSSIGLITLAAFVASLSGVGVLSTMRSVWVTWWGEGHNHPSSDLAYWLSILAALAVADVVNIVFQVGLAVLAMGPISGRRLHQRVLQAVMNAPISVLANSESGSIINRFSQDMRLVDMVLPVALCVFMLGIFYSAGSLGLAIAAVKWIAIAVPFIIFILVMVQRFYVRTSKQLRLLEIESKAPLFGHFLESIHGLATIRAFGWDGDYLSKNLALLQAVQKPWYLLNCVQVWLTLVLDMVIALVIVAMVAISVGLRDKISPNLLGVALVQLMTLGESLKVIIFFWSNLETSLGAVTRIKNFVEATTPEDLQEENKTPHDLWLSQGNLKMKNLAVQYSEAAGPVVRNVSLSISHGEKIGLCGRSGSGKSSIVQALLRMADIAEGQIELDGEDITTLPRLLIRQKLSCITQEPFLFTNTIRFNADPLDEHTNDAIINALRRVGIWDVIKAKVGKETDPLDEKMTESFFSHGQRQLFCLGRALLKKSSIFILDEPTSSVDRHTDAMIQQIIRTEFNDRTIIMIAHRLDTVLDFDRIAVLENGTLTEFDSPQNLLKNPDGCFTSLYRADKTKKERSLLE